MNEGSPISIALELIRKDGLIVLALAALMWQVWFVSSNAHQEQVATRAQMNDFAALARETLEQRRQSSLELTGVISTLNERVAQLELNCIGAKKAK
jgi:hypothetical protein